MSPLRGPLIRARHAACPQEHRRDPGTGNSQPARRNLGDDPRQGHRGLPDRGFAGFYLQTPGTGGDLTPANHTASDAIFVYAPSAVGSVQIGDYLEVTGDVAEYYGMTQLNVSGPAGVTKLTEAAPEVKATGFSLPADEAFRESLEGMLLTPQGPVTVTDNFSLNQYGEIGLAGGTTPLEQPTAVAAYGSPEYTATVAANAARGIKLDDGASTNFLKDATTKALTLPYLTTADPVRSARR